MHTWPIALLDQLRSAQSVAVLTGAGTSAESGVPTFRDAQTGLWAKYDPAQLATPEAFQRNPKLVWEWYAGRRELVAKAQPNAAHAALVVLQQKVPHLTLITQNVDGLHQRAGSTDVIELHGNLTRIRCTDAGHVASQWDETDVPPFCPHPQCTALLRPDVVWFGEALPAHALHQAAHAATHCDLLLSIGTSSLVYPAASLPELALQQGIPVLEINPNQTPLTAHASYFLQGPSGQVLPALLQATWPNA